MVRFAVQGCRVSGYDVRDFKKIAPRYGTNEDARHLFEEAHRKGIHVLLDLVAGYTSEEHAWFRQSQRAVKNAYTDRYIWTDFCFENGDGIPYVAGESERSAAYLLNFYKCQPALNYGFLNPDSLLTFVSKLLKFRGSREELNSDATFEVVYARQDSPVFAYRRGRLLAG